MDQANTPEAWYKGLPHLTRYALTTIFCISLVVQLEIVNPVLFILDWQLVTGKLHLWRLITAPLFYGGFSFNFLFQLYFFSSFSSKLERNEIFEAEPGGYLLFFMMMLLLLCSLSLILAYPTGLPMLGVPLNFSIIYYWSRREPYAQISFFSFVLKGYQLPFALLFIQLLMGGSIWGDLIGLAAGHIYYFVKEVVPQEYGVDYIKVPKFLQKFAMENLGNAAPRGHTQAQEQQRQQNQMFQGQGNRLGGN